MKQKLQKGALFLAFCLGFSKYAQAQNPINVNEMLNGLTGTVVYGLVGMGLMLLAFKMIDWITPGKLSEQIAKENNTALAIVYGAAILGISIIIAAAVAG